MSSDRLADRILRFLGADTQAPRQMHELAEAMGVGEEELGDFHAACRALMRTGRVVLGAEGGLMPQSPPGKVVGTFRANPRGFGFVIPETPNAHGDLYVPAGKAGDAVTGDTVVARVVKSGKRGGRMLHEGRIIEVLRRGQNRFVGELCRQLGRWYVIPDGHALHAPIQVGDPGAKDAVPGDQVVLELTRYPSPETEGRGVIVKVLGERGTPTVDTLSAIEQYGLPGEFEEDVLRKAYEASADYDPKRHAHGRDDLRSLTIITIDPDDARDFDDAISLTKNRDGTVELGVHIADVAHFVRQGGSVDEEARQRANSVYLPRMVIPMLPETLSNDVCSLQERQPRLTKSVFITYSRRGAVMKTRFANTIIRSTKRLTYAQASRILEGKSGRTSAKVVALLKDMESLAKAIRSRRLRAGMLELDLTDTELVFDAEGHVVDVVPEDSSFSHKIIEMFMVEANEAVSRLLTTMNLSHLRRIHDEPRDLAGGNLRRFLAILGHELIGEPDRFALQKLLDSVRGKDDAFPVHLAVLRSMQQAEYAPARIGHYALASRDYCHFTSPIRRYPDLTVHRLLDRYLNGTLTEGGPEGDLPTEEELAQLGKHCTVKEQRAEAAERELKLVLTLRLLEKHVGDEFPGVVTGIANIGVFVQLYRYQVEGLLRFDGLRNDWWELDPSRGCVIGQRTGIRITVGDRVVVTISRIHLPTRQMELATAGPLSAKHAGERAKPGRRARTRAPAQGSRARSQRGARSERKERSRRTGRVARRRKK